MNQITEFAPATPQGLTIMSADPAAIAAAEMAKQRLQAAYSMAAMKPRNVMQARQNLLSACKRPGFAERVIYSKPIGRDFITGPSIRFAEAALREWGNILSDIQVVYEDERNRRVRVLLIDLETNAQFTKELTIGKTVERRFAKDREVISERKNSRDETVYIVKATDDEIAIKEAAAISKAIRNEGLRLIPSDIVDEALDVAKETMHKQIKDDPEAAKRKLIDAFGAVGVKVKALEDWLGHSVDTVSKTQLAELRTMYASIKEGETSWRDYMELKNKAPDEDKKASDLLASAAKDGAAKKTAAKKEAPVEVKPDPVEAKPEPTEAATAEETRKTKGQLIAEIMELLKLRKRDQTDLIRWAEDNKHVEKGDCETLQDFDTDTLRKFTYSWSKIVL
jgi:hypothetical protein